MAKQNESQVSSEPSPVAVPTPTPQLIAVDPAQLVALVRDMVVEVMKALPQQQQTNEGVLDQMADRIGSAVADGMAKNTRRKVTYGEYILHPHSTTHSDPACPAGPKMTRKYFQNGYQLVQSTTHDPEIRLLNQITHSGRYLDRLVEVRVDDENGDIAVHVNWNSRTPDQRFEMKGKAKDFVDMLTQIVTAQKEEDADYDEQQEARRSGRRHFGDNAASREARQRAGM